MSAPASRRGFLSGLAMLPLIGGGATLASPTVDPHETYREALHTLHAERATSRAIDNEADGGSIESRACQAIYDRLQLVLQTILTLDPPRTMGGLAGC